MFDSNLVQNDFFYIPNRREYALQVATQCRTKMGDKSLLHNCALSLSLRNILEDVNEDDVLKTFMAIRKPRPKK
jgi:hypothetical protein